ncbi:MAG TPA: hypothetical protein VGK45_13720 [Thermoanaerobaculia bacterium]
MRKNRSIKLTLKRETVRNLQQGLLDRLQGAGQTDNTCNVSGCLECPTPTIWGCDPW